MACVQKEKGGPGAGELLSEQFVFEMLEGRLASPERPEHYSLGQTDCQKALSKLLDKPLKNTHC